MPTISERNVDVLSVQRGFMYDRKHDVGAGVKTTEGDVYLFETSEKEKGRDVTHANI